MQKVDFYALTSAPLPARLHAVDSACSIRLLSPQERLQVEDRFFAMGRSVVIEQGTTAVVISQVFTDRTELDECATLVEFALTLLTISGFQPVEVAAIFQTAQCLRVVHRLRDANRMVGPSFAKSLTGSAMSMWFRRFLSARSNTPDRMHITADRFVRYSRALNESDALMDLCISLESLLDTQTEISFRFGICLTKLTGEKGKNAEEVSALLSDLYTLRSKIAHGDPSAIKLLRKIQPQLPKLRHISRMILTKYVLFMSDHSRDDWQKHLRTLIFE